MSVPADFINQVMRQSEEPDVSSSVDIASRRDPDLYAESLTLADEQKLPVDTVGRQIEEVRRRKLLSEIDLTDLTRSYPKTSKYLSNTDNASVSIDDIDSLRGLEDTTRSLREIDVDTSVDVYKSLIGLGEAAVGVMDMATWNSFGNILESLGYNPERTKQILSEYYSTTRKRADVKVAQAKGFTDTAGALLENFSTTGVGSLIESAPMMIGIAGATRAVAANMLSKAGIAPGSTEAAAFFKQAGVRAKLATVSGVSEGAIVAGQIQEGARQAGRDWEDSIVPSLAAGVGTALISKFSSKLLPDVEAGFAVAPLQAGTRESLLASGKQIAKGMIKEGVLEEMPQSAQEQVWTNLALGKPATEGIGEAAAQGLIIGTAMGGGMSTGTETIALMNRSERQVKHAVASLNEQEQIDQIISYAQSSTTRGRAPERFEEYVNSLGADRDVLIPVDIAAELKDAPSYITDQIDDLGGTVAIPLRKFASEIAVNEEWMGIIRPHIKLSEGSMSQQEIDDGGADEGLKSLLKRAQASKDTLTEADKVFETVKTQLVATGKQSDQTARYSALLYPAAATVYVEKARKKGKEFTVQQAFEMMGFRVENEATPGGEQRRGEIVDQQAEPTFSQKQSFEGVQLSEQVTVEETGETVTVTQDAQVLWDQVQGRRNAVMQMRDCLNAA